MPRSQKISKPQRRSVEQALARPLQFSGMFIVSFIRVYPSFVPGSTIVIAESLHFHWCRHSVVTAPQRLLTSVRFAEVCSHISNLFEVG